MKAPQPHTAFRRWRPDHLFNIDFADYTLSHHSFPRHFHDHYVIELVLEGADHFYCDGHHYTAGNDQLVLINPGEVHTGSTNGDTVLRYTSLYPDQQTFLRIAETLQVAVPAQLNFGDTLPGRSSLVEKTRSLFDSLNRGDDPTEQEQYFFACMQELLQQPGKKEPATNKKDPRVKILTDHIAAHFREELSLAKMAALVNCDPFYLTRLFKKATGLTPYDHLLILRTEFAKQLLGKGYKVQDAAQASGFYDSSHLNRSLRKMAGTSPKTFRSSKGQYRTSFTG